jgi:hypothetical protein
MSYLYKRSNRFWHFLIRHRLTARVWRPLMHDWRRRHLRWRRRMERMADAAARETAPGMSHCAPPSV